MAHGVLFYLKSTQQLPARANHHSHTMSHTTRWGHMNGVGDGADRCAHTALASLADCVAVPLCGHNTVAHIEPVGMCRAHLWVLMMDGCAVCEGRRHSGVDHCDRHPPPQSRTPTASRSRSWAVCSAPIVAHLSAAALIVHPRRPTFRSFQPVPARPSARSPSPLPPPPCSPRSAVCGRPRRSDPTWQSDMTKKEKCTS